MKNMLKYLIEQNNILFILIISNMSLLALVLFVLILLLGGVIR